MHTPWWMWAAFAVVILALLAFDLGVLHKDNHEITVKESLRLSVFYFCIALLFGIGVWYAEGLQKASDYYTGYLVEESLSLDNIFVISLVLAHFQVPRRYECRVLFWGILGAILLRGLMIGVGAALVSHFVWVLYLFSAFLVYVGVKMLVVKEQAPDISQNTILRFLKKHWHVTHEFHGEHFFIQAPHRRYANKLAYWMTPLFVALIMVNIVDIIFAIDSIPAIFVITTDPFIVYTSNIFAILGLRALYFTLSAFLYRFYYLQHALALVLIFIGSKIMIADLLGIEKFPSGLSLGITLGLLAAGILFSLLKPEAKQSN